MTTPFNEVIARRTRLLSDNIGLSLLSNYLKTSGQRDSVFVWIPKNAGSSFTVSLNLPKLKTLHRVRTKFPGRGAVTFGHMDYRKLVDRGYVSRRFDQSAFKYAFVRNPYDRAISLFRYLKARNLIAVEDTLLTFCRQLHEKGCEPIGLYNRNGLSMCNPQVRWIESLDIDYIGRYETIESDAIAIMKQIGIEPRPLPRVNIVNKEKYDAVFCEESRQLIANFYEEDFKCLGYSSEGLIRS